MIGMMASWTSTEAQIVCEIHNLFDRHNELRSLKMQALSNSSILTSLKMLLDRRLCTQPHQTLRPVGKSPAYSDLTRASKQQTTAVKMMDVGSFERFYTCHCSCFHLRLQPRWPADAIRKLLYVKTVRYSTIVIIHMDSSMRPQLNQSAQQRQHHASEGRWEGAIFLTPEIERGNRAGDGSLTLAVPFFLAFLFSFPFLSLLEGCSWKAIYLTWLLVLMISQVVGKVVRRLVEE